MGSVTATERSEIRSEALRGETRAARFGGWLFKLRGLTPVPFYLAILLVSLGRDPRTWLAWSIGAPLVILGEGLRLWAIGHIGRSARTRRAKARRLVATGPYTLSRNPLYVGNVLIYVGFAAASGLFWMMPVALVWFAFQYHCIVAWEEGVLREKQGESYLEYCAQVPRWFPTRRPIGLARGPAYPLSEILYRERDTLLGLIVVTALLLVREWCRRSGWL